MIVTWVSGRRGVSGTGRRWCGRRLEAEQFSLRWGEWNIR